MTPLPKKIILLLLIWAGLSCAALYLRSYPLRNHVSDEINEKATLAVIKNIRQTVAASIAKNFATLPDTQKMQLAKAQFDQTLRDEGPRIRETITAVARQMTAASPDDPKPFYLLASDSYYYLGLTQNILTTGRLGERKQGSKYFNPLMLAPLGFWEPINIYPFIGSLVYKAVLIFNPGASLMEGVSFTPLVFTVLILFAFIATCAVLGITPLATLLAGAFFISAPIFLRRSMFGWYDDDPGNILMMLLIFGIFVHGIKKASTPRAAVLCALLCGGCFTLYALLWHGWMFLACILAASGAAIVFMGMLPGTFRAPTKDLIRYFCLMGIFTFVGISMAFGPKEFFILFQEGWAALRDFLNPQLSAWPDLYIAVGELLSPAPKEWLKMLGGPVFVGLSALGVVLAVLELLRNPTDRSRSSLIALIVFWVVAAKLSLGAQRFQTLFLIPCALGFAVAVDRIFRWAAALCDTYFAMTQRPRTIVRFLSVLLLVAACFYPLTQAAKQTPQLLNKIFNATWDRALTKLKTDTPQDSIISTWWPPGHFIKAISRRRVTFDGATINKPQSYWLANVLLTDDERRAAGIMRMLNVSGNQAAEFLTGQGMALSQATDLLKRTSPLDRETAEKILGATLPHDQARHLLSLIYQVPPASYLLLYPEMAESPIQFSFVGNWDFSKVELIQQAPHLQTNVPRKGAKEYVPFLWKIAGGQPLHSEAIPQLTRDADSLLFDHQIKVDMRSMTCTVQSPKFGQGIPRSIFYVKDGQFHEKKFTNATLAYSVMLIQDKGGFKIILTDPAMGRSMLMRLYYFNGVGLKIFEPFLDESDLTGRTRILVYKINWDKL